MTLAARSARRTLVLLSLAACSHGTSARAPREAAAATPADPAGPWTIAPASLACDVPAGRDLAGCRVEAALALAPGAVAGADAAAVTVEALDRAGGLLGCWSGERIAAADAARTTVDLLLPAETWTRAASFAVYPSSWGCWGTPAVLGPRVVLPRAAAIAAPDLVPDLERRARERSDLRREDADPGTSGVLELGPLRGPGGDDGC